MLNHLFVSSDGALYDTRAADWSKAAPLRSMFRFTFNYISTVERFKATLRNGAYAWPGGYPLYLLTDDGAALCFDCGRKEARQIMAAIGEHRRDGWRVVACDVNYEDNELHCDHCSRQIESAYGAD